MTFKKALERLYLGIYSPNEMANYYDLVLKALERLEELEEENQELKKEHKPYLDLLVNNAIYQCENEKLKKAIEILKKNHEIVLHYDDEFPTPMISINGVYSYINKQEYELLKEVLENDTSDNIK